MGIINFQPIGSYTIRKNYNIVHFVFCGTTDKVLNYKRIISYMI
jgi:hypothetical protein